MVTTSQELSHSTKKFVKLAGDYLGKEIPLCCSMETWPCHVDHFGWNYDNTFSKDSLFGADLTDRVHKRVQVFLHS